MNKTFLLSCPIFAAGKSMMARGGMHPRIKIVQAWVQVTDTSSRNQIIEIIGISNPLTITSGYSAGVTINFMPHLLQLDIPDMNDIIVNATTNRKLIINLLCEAYDLDVEKIKAR